MSGSNPERRLTALARILKLLRETDDFEQLVQTLLENLQEELHYTLLWLGLYERDQNQIVSQGYIAPQPHRLLKSTFTPMPGDLLEQVVIQQRPLIVNDLRVEARIGAWNELAEQFNIQGTLLFPVRRRDICYGMLLLGSSQWGQTLSTGDRTFFVTINSTLADVLYQREQVLQEQQRKNPGTSVISLINQLKDITDRDDQLEAISKTLFQFIEPDRVRVFWLNPAQFEFWERLTLLSQKTTGYKRFPFDKPGLKITSSDIRGVYHVLINQQLLVVGESQGSLINNVPERLLQILNARALMIAPILHHQTLLGFISVERKTPEVWSEASCECLTTVAHLAGLLMPESSAEEMQQQSEADLQLLTGIVRSIQNDTDWRVTLEKCGHDLCQRLATQQFLVLLHDAERGGYNLVFQKLGASRKKVSFHWDSLDDVDWQMLERSHEAIAINDLTSDLKLLAWRENFQTLQVQALLACNVSPGNPPEGVVLLASQSPRHWTPAEGQLLQKVAQQIGLILHQWQLLLQTNQQEDLYDSIQWGLRSLQQTFQLDQLEAAACQHIIELFKVSLVVLVSWQSGQSTAQVSHVITRHKDFKVNEKTAIPLGSDAVINWALQTDGPLSVTWEDFPEDINQWISGPAESKFLLIALRTAEGHAPNSVWILADGSHRKWTDHHLSLITLLANQLAWSRRHLSIVELLTSQREALESLNWYKHRRFNEVHRRLEYNLQRLNEPITQGKGLTAQRQLQLIRQLGSLTSGMQEMLAAEEWHLKLHHQTTPLISLINRSIERVNPLIQAQHLWTKVHNNSNVIISGDLDKIEFILHEALEAACRRSPTQGRLDIWCRPLDRNWLELSITDDGTISKQLLTELQNGRPDDILVPSSLDTPPGLNFSICQALMRQMKGGFSLQKLEDGRIMSRMVLAIAGKHKSTTPLEEPL